MPVLGQAYRRSNDLAKMGPQLLHAIELRPDNYDAHYVLGMVLAAPGRTEEAITQMATAEKLNPHAPGAHYKLSVLYKDMTLDIRRNWKRLCA